VPLPLSPEQRSLRARIAAYAMHAQNDSQETTRAGRQAFMSRFLDEVDPDRTLPEPERLRRASYARQRYFAQLSYRSAKVRAARKAAG